MFGIMFTVLLFFVALGLLLVNFPTAEEGDGACAETSPVYVAFAVPAVLSLIVFALPSCNDDPCLDPVYQYHYPELCP